MNDALRLQISAFVDGELPENENELLLRRLSQDAALRQQVAQYLTIGRLIRRDHEVPGMSELRDRIAAALGEEPAQQQAETVIPASRSTRPAVGAAIAATVAVMAILGIRQIYAPVENAEIVADEQFPTEQANSTTIAQPDHELLKQFYLQHNPRLVTWELQGGTLVEIEPEDDPSDELDDDEETQD
jgi:negative regulator of sigma E activity